MRIFRQQHAGWTEVMQEIAAALRSEIDQTRPRSPARWLRRMMRL
jgi:hypothetical protein